MATEREMMTARIFLRAVFPVIKVLLEDEPKMARRFKKVKARVQFRAKDPAGDVGASLVFDNGAFSVEQGIRAGADIEFVFRSVSRMNAMFAGKPAVPFIKGLHRVGLLIKVFSVLMGLMVLMPNVKPKDP
ncbi:MAG: hypothetical protein KKA60_06395, partial [Proteobacteria bacterium]|nr:hypothetical protein [Pseudomonadota bacterium]